MTHTATTACDTGDNDEPLPQSPAIELPKSGTWVDGDGDGYADVGETITYTFTVKNIGNVTLYNVVVTDPNVTVLGGPLAAGSGRNRFHHLHRQLRPLPG